MFEFALLVKGGLVVDPANGRQGRFDLGLADGKVASVEPELPCGRAREIYDATGKLVLPGLVDCHAHVSDPSWAAGLRMLARAGVTSVLDPCGSVNSLVQNMVHQGSGIGVAVLHWTDPGVNISGANATRQELAELLEISLSDGALGLKILGGHLPLTPEATVAAIELANAAGVYIAFHCGSTRNGSNVNGLLDAFEFAGDNRLHICHVNAYCRGFTHGSPVAESIIALNELAARPHLVSESYMASMNCTSSQLDRDVVRSEVTQNCLKAGGFPPNREGLMAAARAGYTRVQIAAAGEVTYLEPEAGVSHLEAVGFDAWVSFPVNPSSTAFLMATEKDEDGRFVITALATDGGGIPRNVLLNHGLSLVQFDALKLSELVQKCSWMPARMLGLSRKGHLGPGADGDLVVVDPATRLAKLTVVRGKVIMIDGVVVGSGGTLFTTEKGARALQEKGIPYETIDLADSLLYTAPAAWPQQLG